MKTQLSLAQYRTAAYIAMPAAMFDRVWTATTSSFCRGPKSPFESSMNEKLSIVFDILSIISSENTLLTHVISETYDFFYRNRATKIRSSHSAVPRLTKPFRTGFAAKILFARSGIWSLAFGHSLLRPTRLPQKKPCHVGTFFHNAPQSPSPVIKCTAQLAEEPK
jgi:hypothetical protein